MTNLKVGDRVYCEGFGKGIVRTILKDKVLVEISNYGLRQYSFNFNEVKKI